MRRVNIRNGIRQHINEIIGTDNGASNYVNGKDVYDITPWSTQAAMMENSRRLGKAIYGNAEAGRIASGLLLTATIGRNTYSISPGVGVTKNGDTIVLNQAISGIVDPSNTYIYLKYVLVEVTVVNDVPDYGKVTSFVGKNGSENIVYDDLISSLQTTITPAQQALCVIHSSTLPAATLSGDMVYVGQLTTNNSLITAVIPSTDTVYKTGIDLVIGVVDEFDAIIDLTFVDGVLVSSAGH